ncbi:hypothetical protein [Micromonospora rubida]|uniref:hypothetical protein n=1 Tax=Micromonospora rubida TaxID=2697657 RepID=UPI001376AB8A|nr:hypothetical protein [Micromonospora rubida]NBE84575.1 hypothetical protein [Micromonospora rubida]
MAMTEEEENELYSEAKKVILQRLATTDSMTGAAIVTPRETLELAEAYVVLDQMALSGRINVCRS